MLSLSRACFILWAGNTVISASVRVGQSLVSFRLSLLFCCLSLTYFSVFALPWASLTASQFLHSVDQQPNRVNADVGDDPTSEKVGNVSAAHREITATTPAITIDMSTRCASRFSHSGKAADGWSCADSGDMRGLPLSIHFRHLRKPNAMMSRRAVGQRPR
jgi:hypothetical protein